MQLRNNRVLLHEDVLRALYDYIDQQQIQPGQQFPSEQELAGQWDISRNVLREAFHILENRGIVISKQGKGRFLRDLPGREAFFDQESLSKNLERYSLVEVYEIRQALECLAVRSVVANATEQDIQELEQEYEKMEAKFRSSNNTLGEFFLHQKYAEKSKNILLKQFLDLTRKIILDMMSNTFREVLFAHSVEENIIEHGRIIAAIRRRDMQTAEQVMYQHLQHSLNKLKAYQADNDER